MKNLIAQGGGQFGGRLLGFIFILYAAKALGPEKFGVFSFSMSVGYMALTVMDFGLDPLSVKWIARGETSRFQGLAKVRHSTVAAGLLLMIICSLFCDANVRNTTMMLSFGFAAMSGTSMVYSYFRGIERMGWEAAILIGQKALLLVTGIGLITYSPSALSAALAFSLSSVVGLWVAGGQLQRHFGVSIYGFSDYRKAEFAVVIKEAYPLALVSFLWVIYYRIDTIMLGAMKSMTSVGIYSGAYRIIDGLILFAAVIMIAQFPSLSKNGGLTDKTLFFKRARNIGLFLVAASLGILTVFYFSASILFDRVLGSNYGESAAVFKILVLALVAIYPGQLVTQALIAMDLQRSYMFIALICAAMNVLLNYLLIPSFGAFGAAWATVITEIAMTLTCTAVLYQAYRNEKVKPCKLSVSNF